MGVLVPARSGLECGRWRTRGRAGERPARAAAVGLDWRDGGVTCELLRRLAAPLPRPGCAGSAGPRAAHTLGGRGGGAAESAPGTRRSRTFATAAARSRLGR